MHATFAGNSLPNLAAIQSVIDDVKGLAQFGPEASSVRQQEDQPHQEQQGATMQADVDGAQPGWERIAALLQVNYTTDWTSIKSAA
jgi:hypothetical protein